MSKTHIWPDAPRMPRRVALVTLLASAGLVVLPSCGGGGGGGIADVGSGGTGSFTTGRISGFGSVIVNGVRFEDNTARIVDEDDEGKVFGALDLRLGMVVRVRGSAITDGGATTLRTATASAITVESQIKGPVDSKTAPDTVVVLGQTVKVDVATVFEGVNFAGIAVGDVLEVHGFADGTGVVTASRIEREGATSEFKLRGVISNLDTTAKTFRIGTVIFNYSGAQADRLPSSPLANGMFVRVRLSTTANPGGQRLVIRIEPRSRIEDSDECEVEGILLQSGDIFSVNGITIDTSRLPQGTVLPVNQRVEVEGEIANGVLVAREIELEDEDEEAEVEARGAVSSVNADARTFMVRGITFHYTPGLTREDEGTISANLIVGATIKVEGRLSGDGSGNVEATEIDFRP